MTVGERIAAKRKENNISQVQLAKMMDVTRQAVSKWENDLSSPDTLHLIHLADALNTDVEYLATGNIHEPEIKEKIVTVVEQVDRIVEKPIVIQKIVEVEKVVQEPPKPARKIVRIKYLRNPIEFIAVGIVTFLFGILVGVLIA